MSKRTIILVGCVKLKQGHSTKAKDLYTSSLFKGRRAYAERYADRWFILSAKHGLVKPDQVIAPYDQALRDFSADERRMWGHAAAEDLRVALPMPLAYYFIEIHAGKDYYGYGLGQWLSAAGAHVSIPTQHLSQGRQLQYYKEVMTHGLRAHS